MAVEATYFDKQNWFKRHFKKRLKEFENRIIKKMLIWFIEQEPNKIELIHLYREFDEDPDMNFVERFRLN